MISWVVKDASPKDKWMSKSFTHNLINDNVKVYSMVREGKSTWSGKSMN